MKIALDQTHRRYRFRLIVPSYPIFNIYSHVARRTTALGPICVASVINEMPGWDVEVIDENNYRQYGPKTSSGAVDHGALQALRPADVVGIYGGLTSTIPRLYEVAGFYKQRGVITVAGGQHFMGENIADALKHNVDYVVSGEGELTMPELLEALMDKRELKKVAGISYRENGSVRSTPPREPITDFDMLPVPDFSLVRYAKINLYPVGRIRGCGMDCEFCTVRGKPRCASPERTMEGIRSLVETNNAKHFFIVDDLFGQDRPATIDFCHMLRYYQESIGKRLDFTVQIRLDNAKDAELLTAMREAGINAVCIGFESPIEEELLAMNKRVKPEDMVALARAYHKFGFLVHGMFIFGYPLKGGHKFTMRAKERVKRFKTFINKAKIDTVQVLLPVPLPGTELRDRLEQDNRIYSTHDLGWEYYDGNFPLFVPDPPIKPEELQASIRKIMSKFYHFKYFFMVGFHLFSFPALLFFLHNLQRGWLKWYRPWRNNLTRFGGWMVLRGWKQEFKKGTFLDKLQRAKNNLKPTIGINH
ncbi:MAG: B12-binding domain-containing radical SAM protein [Candidatus Omnitrophica bacterium]|nr:B12-binding domain-containing radical SAM protein [Candidatus Omnitrophota bacterium]